jgi:uncharacterized damage-inducible protein DinB
MGDYTQEPLADLFRHHLWANLRLLDGCESLSDAQLEATAHGTFGSIRATLLHLVRSDGSYLARLTGDGQPTRSTRKRMSVSRSYACIYAAAARV